LSEHFVGSEPAFMQPFQSGVTILREVIGVFWYHCVMERLYHPACGAYASFGIAACSTSHGRHRKLRFISDVSVDPVRVLRLAARCTAYQLDPSQLMDVVEDLLAE
jgi:hypothetical protein